MLDQGMPSPFHKLGLNHCGITGTQAARLFHAIGENRGIHLGLSGNPIEYGIQDLTAAIREQKGPAGLDLEMIEFKEESNYLSLIDALTETRHLVLLSLAGTAPSQSSHAPCSQELVTTLHDFFARNESVRCLDLSGFCGKLDDGQLAKGFGRSLSGLARNKTMTHLRIRNQNLHDDAGMLGRALAENDTLLAVDCRDNHLNLTSLRFLVDSLRQNTSIIEFPLPASERRAIWRNMLRGLKRTPSSAAHHAGQGSVSSTTSTSSASNPQAPLKTRDLHKKDETLLRSALDSQFAALDARLRQNRAALEATPAGREVLLLLDEPPPSPPTHYNNNNSSHNSHNHHHSHPQHSQHPQHHHRNSSTASAASSGTHTATAAAAAAADRDDDTWPPPSFYASAAGRAMMSMTMTMAHPETEEEYYPHDDYHLQHPHPYPHPHPDQDSHPDLHPDHQYQYQHQHPVLPRRRTVRSSAIAHADADAPMPAPYGFPQQPLLQVDDYDDCGTGNSGGTGTGTGTGTDPGAYTSAISFGAGVGVGVGDGGANYSPAETLEPVSEVETPSMEHDDEEERQRHGQKQGGQWQQEQREEEMKDKVGVETTATTTTTTTTTTTAKTTTMQLLTVSVGEEQGEGDGLFEQMISEFRAAGFDI